MQEDLNKLYKWAEKNIVKFIGGKFEQITCRETKGVDVESYRISLGIEINNSHKVKDLGVVTRVNLRFRECIDSIVASCKIKQGNTLRNFATGSKQPMLNLYKLHIRIKAKYYCTA